MAKIKYVVTTPQALEELIASEESPTLRAVMTLISANPEILRNDLIKQLKSAHPGLQDNHSSAVKDLVTLTIRKLVREGAVQKEVVKSESLGGFAAQFGLTRNQFVNDYRLLVYARIFPPTRQNSMHYLPEVADVFNAAKPLYQNGTPYIEALAVGVGVVFGDEKRRQFEEWYMRYNGLAMKQKRRTGIASQLASSGKMPRVTSAVMYDIMLKSLADGRQVNAAKIKESLEKKLLSSWAEAGNYDKMVISFPVNLYFSLKKVAGIYPGKQGKHKQRTNFHDEALSAVRAAMELTPFSETFESYKQSVYATVSEFWNYAAEVIRAPLEGTLDSVVEQARMLSGSDNYDIRRSAKGVLDDFKSLRARYVTGGRLISLEGVGKGYGVTREAIRLREVKALELLRGLPEVKALLGRNLLEEWKA